VRAADLPSDLTPEAERLALTDMLESDGWAIYMRHMAVAWGSEAEGQALRESRKKVSPEEWPFESARILDTFDGMRANFEWPKERVRTLAEAPKGRAVVDVFAGLRRGPKRTA
jgi:hypothetical protein